MAVTQVYTAVANDVITAARWNNEFGNIYNNGSDISFPLTKAVSLTGYTLTLDSAGASTLISTGAIGLNLTAGSKTGTPGVTGANLNIASSTFTDSNTAGSGTAASFAANSFQSPTLAASNASVLCTDAATVYVANSPANGSNETISNPWAVWVDAGNVRLDGELVASVNPYSLSVVMAANACTVTLLGVNGATTGQIPLLFRSATDTTAALATVMANAGITVTISSGSTLGNLSARPGRVWVGAINNAGTVELFVYNATYFDGLASPPKAAIGPSTKGISRGAQVTTVTEGGAGAADLPHVLYSTTARTNVPYVWLGYFEHTEATAGTWATAASKVQMHTLGGYLPGEVIQTQMKLYTDVATGTTVIPADNTTPLITEGDQYMSYTITPFSAANVINVHALLYGTNSAGSKLTITLNDATNTLAVGASGTAVAGQLGVGVLDYYDMPGVTSQITYNVRFGCPTAGTTTFNGEAGVVRYNLLMSHIKIQEIMG